MVKVGVASGGCRSLFYTGGGGDDAVSYSIADCFLLFCVSKCALLLLVVVVVGVLLTFHHYFIVFFFFTVAALLRHLHV